MDTSKISNIVFDDVDYSDYPDFCDAFISSAEIDGRPLTESELETLNEDSSFIHEKLIDNLF
jgi:hypothetical protein